MSLRVAHYRNRFLIKSENFILDIVTHRRNYEPAVFCLFKENHPPEVRVESLDSYGHFRRMIERQWYKSFLIMPPSLQAKIRDYQPSILHAHFGRDGYRCLGLKQRLNIPLVVSFYGIDASAIASRPAWIRRYSNLFRLADSFVVLSNDMKNDLLRLGCPDDKISIIALSVDALSIPFAQRTKTSKFMMIGRFVEKKGIPDGLRAFEIVSREYPQATLTLVGDGDGRPDVERTIRDLSIADKVTLTGWLSNDEVRRLMCEHSVLLAPSKTAPNGDKEGIPYVITEAMASGMPVVSTRHAGIPEAVLHGEVGLLAPEGDVDELARCMLSMLANPHLTERFSLAARRRVEVFYDSTRLCAQREDLYTRLIQPQHTDGA